MSFFKFTALTIAIDACDVAIIAPRTVGLDTDSTVLMARGQSVLPALTPAEAAAEVDATVDGDPLMAGPYDTLELGDGCYFGGRQVQRIAPTADGLGCIVTFGNVPAVLTVPDVDVDTMTDDLNATGECGGGGAGGGAVGGPYVPVIVGTTATATGASFMRSGGPTPEQGDFVLVAVNFEVTALADETVDFEVTVPVTPADLLAEVPILTVQRTSGDLTLPYIYAQLSGAETFRIQAVGPVTLETTMVMSLHFSYLVDGV